MESIPFESGEAEESRLSIAGSNVHHSEKPLKDRFADTSRNSLEVQVVGQDLMFAGLSNRAIHPEVRKGRALVFFLSNVCLWQLTDCGPMDLCYVAMRMDLS